MSQYRQWEAVCPQPSSIADVDWPDRHRSRIMPPFGKHLTNPFQRQESMAIAAGNSMSLNRFCSYPMRCKAFSLSSILLMVLDILGTCMDTHFRLAESFLACDDIWFVLHESMIFIPSVDLWLIDLHARRWWAGATGFMAVATKPGISKTQ